MRNIKGFLRHFYFWSWYLLENGLENGEGGGRKQWDIEKRDANNNYFIFNFWFFQSKGNPKSWSLSLEVVDKDCIFCLAEVESALKPYQHATWSVCVCVCLWVHVFSVRIFCIYTSYGCVRVNTYLCVHTIISSVAGWYAKDALVVGDKAFAQEFAWLMLHLTACFSLDFHYVASLNESVYCLCLLCKLHSRKSTQKHARKEIRVELNT